MTADRDRLEHKGVRPPHAPFIVLSDPTLLEVVRAGVRRACGAEAPMIRTEDAASLRSGPAGRPEVVIVVGEAPAAIRVLRRLGARPIPVLGLGGSPTAPSLLPATRDLLEDPEFRDLEIPVPAVEDDAIREVLWDRLREGRVEERHHLVEVDGRPAIEASVEEGRVIEGWAPLAAGAAGILAGRLAAGNRRWRAQLEA